MDVFIFLPVSVILSDPRYKYGNFSIHTVPLKALSDV